MDLSVIIVNYNTRELTTNAIASVIGTVKTHSFEIIVVDNGSTDGSEEAFAVMDTISLVETNANLGFSKANNIGMKMAGGSHVLLLNSDTVVHEGAIDKALTFMEKTGYRVLGAKVLLPDGNLDKACKRSFPTPSSSLYHYLAFDRLFPSNQRFGSYNLTYLSMEETSEVECIMGAFMLLSKEVLDKVGLLDEDYFMYGEDIDWCYRIHEAGFPIVYYPEAVITHYKKASFNKRRKESIREFYDSMWIFYRKHYKGKYHSFVTWSMYTGIKIKMMMDLAMNSLKR